MPLDNWTDTEWGQERPRGRAGALLLAFALLQLALSFPHAVIDTRDFCEYPVLAVVGRPLSVRQRGWTLLELVALKDKKHRRVQIPRDGLRRMSPLSIDMCLAIGYQHGAATHVLCRQQVFLGVTHKESFGK